MTVSAEAELFEPDGLGVHPHMRQKGRGALGNPSGRFEPIEVVYDPDDSPDEPEPLRTRFYKDATQSILSFNDSPDVGFEASVNPYRGCEAGCGYCFARPFHEYLDLSPGLDFETKIFVKEDAPELLRRELAKVHRGEMGFFSLPEDSGQAVLLSIKGGQRDRALAITERILHDRSGIASDVAGSTVAGAAPLALTTTIRPSGSRTIAKRSPPTPH